MKRALFAGAALALVSIVPAIAADLAVKAPVYKAEPVAPSAWTHCYIGVAGGGNWGRTSNVDISPGFVGLPVTNPFDLSGAIFGGTLGCNYQIQKWVIGLEGDISWTNKNGAANEIPPFIATATLGVREHWIDTLRARIGYNFGNAQSLLYVTGGGAAARVEVTTCLTGVACTSVDNTMTGWTVGGGGEWAILPFAPPFNARLTFKLEYLYVNLGSKDFLFNPTAIPGITTTNKNVSVIDHIVRAGINWHF
jgi:outer membrane immunogenic protein